MRLRDAGRGCKRTVFEMGSLRPYGFDTQFGGCWHICYMSGTKNKKEWKLIKGARRQLSCYKCLVLSQKKTSEKKKRKNPKMTQGFQSERLQWSELIQWKGKFVWCQRIEHTLMATKVHMKTGMQTEGRLGPRVLPESPGENMQGQSTGEWLQQERGRNGSTVVLCLQEVGSETRDESKAGSCTHPLCERSWCCLKTFPVLSPANKFWLHSHSVNVDHYAGLRHRRDLERVGIVPALKT